jgi:uncharacterized membrane protein YdfJ with MMPL/SSD domain
MLATQGGARAASRPCCRAAARLSLRQLVFAVAVAAFAAAKVALIKVLGAGLLVAELVDAMTVRALLMPATLGVLGRAA